MSDLTFKFYRFDGARTVVDIDDPRFEAALDIMLQELPEQTAKWRKEQFFKRLTGEIEDE